MTAPRIPSPESSKDTSQKISFSNILMSTAQYLVMFIVIYSVINWWRQPTMPVHAQLKHLDYRGAEVDLLAMSTEEPTLIYFWGSWCGACSITSDNIRAC